MMVRKKATNKMKKVKKKKMGLRNNEGRNEKGYEKK